MICGVKGHAKVNKGFVGLGMPYDYQIWSEVMQRSTRNQFA